MFFKSTRDSIERRYFSEAISQPLAMDQGLWVPEVFPTITWKDHRENFDIQSVARLVLRKFLSDDVLYDHIDEIVERSLNFDVPITVLPQTETSQQHYLLELTKGPTAAFKDIGARFLATSFSIRNRMELVKDSIVLVATSGDTGSAVASAFYEQPGTKVVLLYPKGKVSPIQESQLTCWDKNIYSFSVEGTFDDCQRMVKEIFSDAQFTAEHRLVSANSINIGRILPQTFYYAFASIWYWNQHKQSAPFIIPTGNLGNAVACFWAKEMGFPIDHITIACNENKSIPLYFEKLQMIYQDSISTLANAMDVGKPSNLERLAHLYQYPNPDAHKRLCQDAQAISVTDSQIVHNLLWAASESPFGWNRLVCPHTAVGVQAISMQTKPTILVSTAEPAKFTEVLEENGLTNIAMPSSIKRMLERETKKQDIPASSAVIKEFIEGLHV